MSRSLKRFVCSFQACAKSFSRSSHLARHLRIHVGCKPFVCTIKGCSRRFNRRDCWREHLRGVHAVTNIEESGCLIPAPYPRAVNNVIGCISAVSEMGYQKACADHCSSPLSLSKSPYIVLSDHIVEQPQKMSSLLPLSPALIAISEDGLQKCHNNVTQPLACLPTPSLSPSLYFTTSPYARSPSPDMSDSTGEGWNINQYSATIVTAASPLPSPITVSLEEAAASLMSMRYTSSPMSEISPHNHSPSTSLILNITSSPLYRYLCPTITDIAFNSSIPSTARFLPFPLIQLT